PASALPCRTRYRVMLSGSSTVGSQALLDPRIEEVGAHRDRDERGGRDLIARERRLWLAGGIDERAVERLRADELRFVRQANAAGDVEELDRIDGDARVEFAQRVRDGDAH